MRLCTTQKRYVVTIATQMGKLSSVGFMVAVLYIINKYVDQANYTIKTGLFCIHITQAQKNPTTISIT